MAKGKERPSLQLAAWGVPERITFDESQAILRELRERTGATFPDLSGNELHALCNIAAKHAATVEKGETP